MGRFRFYFAAILAVLIVSNSAPAGAVEFPNPFKDKKATAVPRSDMTAEKAEEHYDQALRTLSKLTFLSDNDSRQYARNIESILGYYARLDDEGNLLLLGGSQKIKEQTIDLKDAVIFDAVVKSGFEAGLKLPILQLDLSRNQVAELQIEDIATIASRVNRDEIACGFPYSLRDTAAPKGEVQYYYISALTVLRMSSRTFGEGSGGGSGLFSILSVSGKKYSSHEARETKYLVSAAVTPVSPLDRETCELVASEKATEVAFVEPVSADLEAAGDATGPAIADLKGQINEPALQGKTVGVILSRTSDLNAR